MEHASNRDPNGEDKACVYTVLMGQYEALNEQPMARRSDLPFVCITDDPSLTSSTWQIRVVEPNFAVDPVRSQRIIKLLAHEFLPEFDVSLYIDNCVLLKAPPEDILDRYLASSSFALFQHTDRKTLAQEFLAVAQRGYDDGRRIAEQLAHYSAMHPSLLSARPFWTAILMRRHADQGVQRTMEVWRDHVLRYSRRDQLSFNIACASTNQSPNTILESNWESWLHTWPHATDRKADRIVAGEWTKTFERNLASALGKDPDKGLLAALAAKEAQVKALRSSTSWRVTAPLRATVLAARKAASIVRSLPRPAAAAPKDRRSDQAQTFFVQEGYIGPTPLFTEEQCRLIIKHHRSSGVRGNPKWPKDLAVIDPLLYDLASRPQIVRQVERLLGEKAVIWGTSVVERIPGQIHRIHTDIESSAPGGGFVSVWIGLEGTSRESALQLISRSHRFGLPVQKEFHDRMLRRDQTSDDAILDWAKTRDREASLVQPSMSDGEALFFDGRLWHGSQNSGAEKRTALLLQYAKAGTTVAIQEPGASDWPFRMSGKTAQCLPVYSVDKSAPVSSSRPHGKPAVGSVVKSGEAFKPAATGFVSYHLLRGATPNASDMESHVSVLDPGHSPHPPHRHVEEELLIVLEGEAEIVIPQSADPAGARTERLCAGGFVYYPAYQYHTIRNGSSKPVTYLMYKWRGAPKETTGQLDTTVVNIGPASEVEQAISMPVLLNSPTGYLSRLHAHVTSMKPGAGYPPHVDGHDVAIIVFDGTVETLGKQIGPLGTAFSAAGESHGLCNAGDTNARYLVFEFHA
jgi:mannose-6-phosphate isomerase-like protein (cupin superfamily)